MQTFIQNKYRPEVVDLFNPESLVIALSALNPNRLDKLIPAQERLPGGHLFSDCDIVEENGVFHILKGGIPVAMVEKATESQNGKWRYYNNVDKTKANVCYVLTTGDPNVEMVSLNLIVDVAFANGITTIENNSLINGKHWKEAQPNRTASAFGFWATVNNLQDPRSISGLIYLPAGDGNIIQTGTRRDYYNLTKNPAIPISTDKIGISQADTHADYRISAADLADANVEYFGLTMVWFKGSWKNQSQTMFIDIKKLEGFK